MKSVIETMEPDRIANPQYVMDSLLDALERVKNLEHQMKGATSILEARIRSYERWTRWSKWASASSLMAMVINLYGFFTFSWPYIAPKLGLLLQVWWLQLTLWFRGVIVHLG